MFQSWVSSSLSVDADHFLPNKSVVYIYRTESLFWYDRQKYYYYPSCNVICLLFLEWREVNWFCNVNSKIFEGFFTLHNWFLVVFVLFLLLLFFYKAKWKLKAKAFMSHTGSFLNCHYPAPFYFSGLYFQIFRSILILSQLVWTGSSNIPAT